MFRRAVITAVLVLGIAAPQMAHAQRRGVGETVGPEAAQQQQATRREVEAGQLVPMQQVIANINRRTPGRLLDAGRDNLGSTPVYRVRWQTSDGRRIDYVVDARSGAILSSNGG